MRQGAALAFATLVTVSLAGAALAAFVVLLLPARALSADVTGVTVSGTAFRVALSDGSVLPQAALPGLIVALGDGGGAQRRLRIDTVERDARDPAGEVMLYGLSEQTPDGKNWANACDPDPDGRRLGFPLAGSFTPEMRYVPARDRLLITCTGGAEGKCVRFGYKPWGTSPSGESLAPYYQTCVRLVRADYCGDGVGHTRNGTPIDIFDRIGIQADETAPGLRFEAAFGPDGAVCVAHPRLPEVLSMADLAAACPGLAARFSGPCNEHAPGLLFVRS
jgi:hypothetical protein